MAWLSWDDWGTNMSTVGSDILLRCDCWTVGSWRLPIMTLFTLNVLLYRAFGSLGIWAMTYLYSCLVTSITQVKFRMKPNCMSIKVWQEHKIFIFTTMTQPSDTSFYVTLTSSKNDEFPNNSNTHFQYRIPQALMLTGKWKVGLANVY